MNYENEDELQQLLLELHYDLLDDEQAKSLRAAIQSDPKVASAWATTLRLADQFADAAKTDQPTNIDLSPINMGTLIELAEAPPRENGASASASTKAAVKSSTQLPNDAVASLRTGSWWIRPTMLAVTAATIGLMVVGNWYMNRIPKAPIALLRIQAEAALPSATSATNEFRFVTTKFDQSASSVGGFPVTPATLSFSVMSRNAVLFSGTAETGNDGTGRISIPADLVIPQNTTLRVKASSRDRSTPESELEVPLEPTRCLTYLKVDRPVYRPGETVYFRSLTLQRHLLKANSDVPIRFELLDPSGTAVPGAFVEGVTDRGVGNGSFNIPSTAPGGPYWILAKSLDGFFPDERCEFQVRAYRVPRFKKELDFRKRSYGPGEMVEADFVAQRAEGGALANAKVRITATVDDKVVHQTDSMTTSSGSVSIEFALPSLIKQGSGSLSIVVDDGGTRESTTKTIPIQLGRVQVDFYPEGGYLVEGLKNRIYFSARNLLGKPVHIEGEILNRSGMSVASVKTTRDGMGKFTLMPQKGERYSLKVAKPLDVTSTPKLPAAVKNIPVIDTGLGVFESNQDISMVVRSHKEMSSIVRAVCRGQVVGEKKLTMRVGDNSILLPVAKDTSGVVRITVFDAKSKPVRPLVERLVYRRNEKRLQVEVVDQESVRERAPGEPMRLTLQVRDETGEPTPAVLGIAVVDDAALSLDELERPKMRTHFLLTSEVKKPQDLEHANFYLNEGKEAAASLDLLLGTQGWRRFVSGTSNQAEVDFRQQLIRLLELDGEPKMSIDQKFDNSSRYAGLWYGYRRAANLAWNRFLREVRGLMLLVFLVWLALILINAVRLSRLKTASLLLLVCVTSLVIPGCGSSENSVFRPVSQNPAQADTGVLEAAATTENGADGKTPERIGFAEPVKKASAIDDLVEAAKNMLSNGKKNASEFMSEKPKNSFAPIEPGDPCTLSNQQLNDLIAARGIDAQGLADQLLDELRFPVRQYAHQHQSAREDIREDFSETLYWHPMLITDSQGRASIRFDLSDSVTTFRVSIDGHASGGRIGSGESEIRSRLPFQIEPKLPLEVTIGDRIDLPIAVINTTDRESKVNLSLNTDTSLEALGETTKLVSLEAGQRKREHISLDVVSAAVERDVVVEIHGRGTGSLSDSVRRAVHVSPAGYPARESVAGRLKQRAKIDLPLPQQMVPGSLTVTVRAYPSPLADVMSGVASILREPHGCFEQTSATNYPNAMALLYLRKSNTANPEVSRKAMGMLDRGYQKLVRFECDKLGYEWFGSDPGHEALSAFGLMQFTDMSQVMAIDQEMITRTREWLMSRRNGRGGFHRNPRHLHTWSVKQEIVNAYVLWALTEADVAAGQSLRATSELNSELDRLYEVASVSSDPYLIGLSAATLLNVKRTAAGEAMLEVLSGLQKHDGHLEGQSTVTSSGGLSKKMETTAIATLAFVKSPKFLVNASQAATWISGNRLGSAGFGSTQATVLSLKALVAIADHSQTQMGGSLSLQLGGETIGEAKLPQEPQSGSAIEIDGLGRAIEQAWKENPSASIELVANGTKNLSYTIDVGFHRVTPKNDQACPVRLVTKLNGQFADNGSVSAGDSLRVQAKLINETATGQPMTVAIIGLPGGVEPHVKELDELRESGKFDYYELRGREVVFYWRAIEPSTVKAIDFGVTATVPGKYTGPASRSYLYYTAEQKQWSKPMSLEITPQ